MEMRGSNLVLVIIAVIAIALMFVPVAIPNNTFPNRCPNIIMWSTPFSLIAFGIGMYFCFKK
ncbi:MAG: hypothetical protein QM498_03410 [Desulfobacterium sp.]